MKLKQVGITLALLVVVVLATPEDELIAGTRVVAANLYKALKTTKPNENLIFSPFSLQTIMGLLACSARNDNKPVVQQIARGMSLPWREYDRETAFKKVLGTLKADNDFKAYDATKMYSTHGYSAQDWYKTIVQQVYNVEFENVDFGNNWDATTNINQWVAKNTDNGITNFVNYGDIPMNTKYLLINTLYLKGKWFKPFDPKKNINKDFYSSTGAKEVEMMTALNSDKYYEDNNAQFLKLDLVRDGGNAEMIFVLPKQRQGLNALEGNVEELLKTVVFTNEIVNITLPKFSFDQHIDLKTVLKNMGMNKVFEWGLQLEGLRSPGHPYLEITDIFQKVFIHVDEWGVTAGATTGATAFVDLGPDIKQFVVDHPFLFYVTIDDAILYAGRVMEV